MASMVVIVAVAALVVAFVAFPHRGEELPGVPWLGEKMGRAAEAMPTLDDEAAHEDAPEEAPQAAPVGAHRAPEGGPDAHR